MAIDCVGKAIAVAHRIDHCRLQMHIAMERKLALGGAKERNPTKRAVE
jgi:hypothetical protein